MLAFHLARAFALLSLTAAASAQLHWTRLALPASPPPGDSYRLVRDVGGQGLLLFGGRPVAETWRIANGLWTRLPSSNQPSARSGPAMAYDPNRDRVVLFGGVDPRNLDETWEWDGTVWSRQFPAVSPPARAFAAMAFDAVAGRLLLFGGSGNHCFDDTWTWDGVAWIEMQPNYRPGRRAGAAMASDGVSVHLFGGSDAFGDLDDHWTYRAGQWYREIWPLRPSPRRDHSLTYDPMRQRVVLHGGLRQGRDYSGETWELTSTGWIDSTPAVPGPEVAPHAAAFDRQRGTIVTFGGAEWVTTPNGGHRSTVGDTHEFGPTVRASITQVGAGCAGYRSIVFYRMPLVGERGFWMRRDPWSTSPGLPNVTVLSTSQLAPPLRLGPCALHLAPPLLTLVQPSNQLPVPLSIPDDPLLSGFALHVQIASSEVAPGSGWNGFGFTPAYRIVIGD